MARPHERRAHPPCAATPVSVDKPFPILSLRAGGACRFEYVRPKRAQPCIQHGLATLSICKPQIRRHARAGDVIAAYRSPARGQQPVLDFVGVVAQALPMSEFFGSVRYGARKDGRLYRADGTRDGIPVLAYDREHWTWGGVSEAVAIRKDWRGERVLIFELFLDRKRGGIPRTLPEWARGVRSRAFASRHRRFTRRVWY